MIAEAIKHFGLKITPDKVLLTIQSKGRKAAVGWFWRDRWSVGGKERIHEINLSAEHLKKHDMGELLLHELAHAENCHNGINDCSANQVHNKKFKVQAEALGLEVKPRDKRYGFGFTDLAQPGKDFLAGIQFKRELFEVFRADANAEKKKGPGSRLIKCECQSCGYTIRTTQKWLDIAVPECPACSEELEVIV